MARPLPLVDARELKRAHRTISDLRARNAALEAALHAAYAALAPLAGPQTSPVRKQIGTSDTGEPIFADEPEPDRPRPRQRKWVPYDVPRSNDDVEGGWTPAEREQMDQRFGAAMERQLKTRKTGGRG